MNRIQEFTNGVRSIGKALGFGWRHYEGGEKRTRERQYINSNSADQNVTLTPTERTDLMDISRWLCSNSGLYRGACQLLGRYAVVGNPQSQSADRAWAEAAEAGFAEWAKIPEVTGRMTWADIQRLWNYSIERDGDIGNIFTDNEFPQLQLVEAHHIATGKTDQSGWVDGVRVSRLGRPLFYRITGSSPDNFTDIPAASFMLVGEPNRSTGTRHECAWAAGLNHVRDIKEILGHLKTMVKNESSIALIRKAHGGVLNAEQDEWGASPTVPSVVGNAVLEKIYGGKIPVLDIDENLQSLATDRPGANIQAFLEFIIRDFCAGNGLPFEFVWNPTQLGGPSQRFVIATAQRRIAERQALIERHATRVFGWVVAKLAKRGDIPPMPSDWYRVRWQKPAEITIDVGREQAQDRADFQAGLMDPVEFYGRQGLDADAVLASRAAWARKVMTAAGQPTSAQIPVWMLYNVSDLQVQTEQKIAAAANGIDSNAVIRPEEPQP